jgi:hypothetical protein
MNTLLSFAPLDCDREGGIEAAYRGIRTTQAAGYTAAQEFIVDLGPA